MWEWFICSDRDGVDGSKYTNDCCNTSVNPDEADGWMASMMEFRALKKGNNVCIHTYIHACIYVCMSFISNMGCVRIGGGE